MSLLRRIERALSGVPAAASTPSRCEPIEPAPARVAAARGEPVEPVKREPVAPVRGPAGIESSAKGPVERSIEAKAPRGEPVEVNAAARATAPRPIDPRMSGVYVLWSHRPRPAVRGAPRRVGGADAGAASASWELSGRTGEPTAVAAGAAALAGRTSTFGPELSGRTGEPTAVAAGAGAPAGRTGTLGADISGRTGEASARVAAAKDMPGRTGVGAGGRGFVREVTRWPLAGARPPLLTGRALALPGPAEWRAAGPWLLAHGREDMFDGACFLDVEATGLGHAAGTVAFVVGVVRLVDGGAEVEQWTLSRLSAEAEMLADVAGRVAGAPLVTFNGASFDLPLLRGRLRRCGVDAEALAGPHLDLLPIARRLWRGRAPDCRLGTLERIQLGAHRVGDIPGHAIPAVFWEALRAPGCPRAAEALRRVCAHNLVDLLSMPALARAMVGALAAPGDLDMALRTASHLEALGRRPAALAALAPWIEPLLAGGPVEVQDVMALRERRALTSAAALLRREGASERAKVVREALRRRFPAEPARAGA